ncbi:ileal sodium/bile acid cotransporter-like [Asterias amurensis]|uniref:ileal sodium/bile acid cotransporter-like n=1 Tax=Asterias amurensis TaxID=7602 RepID=UPI003AB6AD84
MAASAVVLLLLFGILLVRGSWALKNTLHDNYTDANGDNTSFEIGNNGSSVKLVFRQTSTWQLMVNSSDEGTFEFRSADRRIFKPTEPITVTVTENTSFPICVTVNFTGEYVGESYLEMFNINDTFTPIGAVEVSVHPPFQTLGIIATVILTVWLVISYVIMAAKVEPRVLLDKIKPPWGVIMGMVCQFVLMPPLAFGVAKVFNLTGALAVGLVLVGTCPGGFFSNIEVLLLDCDIVLSLTMTTFSTFLAVGMMPLNLHIYARPFVDGNSNLETPFQSLLIQLCGLVMPLVIGVPFFHRFKKAREICLKLVKPFTLVLMILGVVLFIPSQYYIFYGDWKVWTTSALMPVLGAFLGISIARIANFSYTFSITVAIETGCQNTLLAVSVAKLYYKDPESDIVAIIPLLIAMVTGFEGLAVAALYYIGLFIKGKMKKGSDSTSYDIEGADNIQTECAETSLHPNEMVQLGEPPGLQYAIPGDGFANGRCSPRGVLEKSGRPLALGAPMGFGNSDGVGEADGYEHEEMRETSLYPVEVPDRPHYRKDDRPNGCVNDGYMADRNEWM